MTRHRARVAWAKKHAGEPYRPGAAGWVVTSTTPATEHRREITSYWFGPTNMWGNTWGPLHPLGARMWPTKAAAEAALRSVFGTPAKWRGAYAERVADAEARGSS